MVFVNTVECRYRLASGRRVYRMCPIGVTANVKIAVTEALQHGDDN